MRNKIQKSEGGVRKYTLKDILLREYPDKTDRANIVRSIAAKIGKHENHVRRIANYELHDKHEAKLSDLMIIAEELDLNVRDLLHESLRDRLSIADN
jgi:hypothetical protein